MLFYPASGLLMRRPPLLSFLIVPKTPVPLLGWDLLSQLKAQIFLSQAAISAAPSFRNK
jgi:hypothetical protein